MRSLVNTVGNPVADDDSFWGRQDDLERLDHLLNAGNHLLVTAPRRAGKTSLLRRSMRVHATRTYAFADLQQAQDAEDVIAEIIRAVRGASPKRWFGSSLPPDDGATLRNTIAGDWRSYGTQAFSALAQLSKEKPAALLLDEVALPVLRMMANVAESTGRGRVDQLFSFLRQMAQQHAGKVAVVLTSSIGIIPVLSRLNLIGSVNNFTRFDIRPWSEEEALGCLEALAEQAPLVFAPGAAARMLERLGLYLPGHVQHFFQLVHDANRSSRDKVDVELVDRVYRQMLLPTADHELGHWEQRLEDVIGVEHHNLARALLCQAASLTGLTPEAADELRERMGVPAANATKVLGRVLGHLVNDGYLIHSEDCWHFASAYLRDYWLARFGPVYRPAGRGGP